VDTELVKRIGLYSVLVISVVAIAAVALPGVAKAPQYRQEMAAVKAISTIHTAEMQYLGEYGHYASTLSQLGPGQDNANLIDMDLARGEKAGYKFVLQPATEGYNLVVTPSQSGLSGRHTYYSDQDMTIHQQKGKEPATRNDPLLGDPILPRQLDDQDPTRP
jgi:type IV pilus assembly protein PilA